MIDYDELRDDFEAAVQDNQYRLGHDAVEFKFLQNGDYDNEHINYAWWGYRTAHENMKEVQ